MFLEKWATSTRSDLKKVDAHAPLKAGGAKKRDENTPSPPDPTKPLADREARSCIRTELETTFLVEARRRLRQDRRPGRPHGRFDCCRTVQPREKYDEIIVDGGQDFRKEWFFCLESFLKEVGVFYVFADPHQSAKPRQIRLGVFLDIEMLWLIFCLIVLIPYTFARPLSHFVIRKIVRNG